MPHQCTGCGHVFPDGSKEMLSGCPDCGGNKFQFQPSGASGADGDAAADGTATLPPTEEEPPEPPEPPSPGGSVAETVAGATQRVKNIVGGDSDGASAGASATGDDHEWPAVGRENGADTTVASEDTAQASARSGTVSPEELPDRPTPDDAGLPDEQIEAEESPTPSASETAVDDSADDAETAGSAPFTGSGDRETGTDEAPDLSDLRAELNDQFESIKIVERGQYELNLMELYDREEYIISLMEDGRYAIEVPETWRGDA
ncbi:Zn-ribbon domain-containing protein [Salinarchaeum laminariae]|uniref:Zn-ribbon domain-containing protein n=1 Tax=Salinarchaeum laminariae TaxID=869888 RepID=UPI0020BFA6C8|nr:Zn-ribbon domain-containing protein [Salinarchaeum laminariae]